MPTFSSSSLMQTQFGIHVLKLSPSSLSVYKTLLLGSSSVDVDSSATNMRQELGWPTLTSRRNLSTAVMAFKSISGLNPPYLSVLFKPLSSHHNTRSSSTRGTRILATKNVEWFANNLKKCHKSRRIS